MVASKKRKAEEAEHPNKVFEDDPAAHNQDLMLPRGPTIKTPPPPEFVTPKGPTKPAPQPTKQAATTPLSPTIESPAPQHTDKSSTTVTSTVLPSVVLTTDTTTSTSVINYLVEQLNTKSALLAQQTEEIFQLKGVVATWQNKHELAVGHSNLQQARLADLGAADQRADEQAAQIIVLTTNLSAAEGTNAVLELQVKTLTWEIAELKGK